MAAATSAESWCATWSRDNDESPAGTAVAADRFVLVELPLPWPAEIDQHELLSGIAPVPGTRLQAITGAQGCGYEHTVICYWRNDDGWFSAYSRRERRVARPRLTGVIEQMLRGEGLDGETDDRIERDLLLCTHGTRDRCCAKLGGALFQALSERLPSGARLWRTSHTGGHRFAPTGLSFPDGLMWAGLDLEVALGVIERNLPIERAVRHLRGCSGLGSPLQQAAEAAVFASSGWSWIERPRRATVVGDDGATATVDVASRDGGRETVVRAAVERGRTLPVAVCGAPITAAVKTTTELRVAGLSDLP